MHENRQTVSNAYKNRKTGNNLCNYAPQKSPGGLISFCYALVFRKIPGFILKACKKVLRPAGSAVKSGWLNSY